MKKNIYPEVSIHKSDNSFKLETTIRKFHDGKWYLWDVTKQWVLTDDTTTEDITKMMGIFYREVYFVITLGIINLKTHDADGFLVFKEDVSQISETDRIRMFIDDISL